MNEVEAVKAAIANTTDSDGDRMDAWYTDSELHAVALAAIAALEGSRSVIEVTQADRLLVADILDEVSDLLDHTGIGQVADLIRDGEYDEHDCVVIATHHRVAAENAALEEAAKVAEQTDTGWMDARTFTAQKIATSIRALKGPTDEH